MMDLKNVLYSLKSNLNIHLLIDQIGNDLLSQGLFLWFLSLDPLALKKK